MVQEIKLWLLLIASFFIALLLTFLRLPIWGIWIYPQWLGLMVLVWAWLMPQRVNVGVAWLVGILLDFLYDTPVGTNALALVLATYLLIKVREKIGFGVKFLVVLSLTVGWQLLPQLIQLLLGKPAALWPVLSRSIVSLLVWLIIVLWFNRKQKWYFESSY